LKGHQEQALVHNSVSSSELWHRIITHINYRALSILGKMVIGLPDIRYNVMKYAKVAHLARMSREALLAVTIGPRVSWTSYTLIYADI
jgi:hypothetical protein